MGILLPLVVPHSFVVADLDVALDVAHTFLFDLAIDLVDLRGVREALLQNPTTPASVQTACDDAAVPGLQGTFRPVDVLSTFDSIDAEGTWSLSAADEYADDVGSVRSFCLLFETWTPGPILTNTTALQWGAVPEGSEVSLQGVVTAVAPEGLYVQDEAGGPRSGAWIFLGPLWQGTWGAVSRGDRVSVDGLYTELDGLTQVDLTLSVAPDLTVRSSGAEPAPIVVAPTLFADPDATASLEAMLIRVEDVVIGSDLGSGEYELGNPVGPGWIRGDDQIYRHPDQGTGAWFPSRPFLSITGPLNRASGNFLLEPRAFADFEEAPLAPANTLVGCDPGHCTLVPGAGPNGGALCTCTLRRGEHPDRDLIEAGTCWGGNPGRELIWTFDLAAGSYDGYSVDTCTGAGIADSSIAVFDGDPLGAGVEVACSEDAHPTNFCAQVGENGGGVAVLEPTPASGVIQVVIDEFQDGVYWDDYTNRLLELELFDSRCGNGIVEPFEVCDDGNLVGGDGCRSDCRAVTLLREGFDSGIPASWTLIDNDGLTPSLGVSFVTDAWVEDYGTAVSTSSYSPPGASDDWMITDAIPLGDDCRVKWFGRGSGGGYELRISTTTPDVTGMLAEPPLLVVPSEGSPVVRHASLAAYAGQVVYLAWWNNSYDDLLLWIDDIVVE